MKQVVTEMDLAPGCVVWIKRRRCTIVEVHPSTNLRVFRRDGLDKDYSLTRHELQALVRHWDIVPDRIHQQLPSRIREVLGAEWNLFDATLRRRAESRAAVCRELDGYGPVKRREEAVIQQVIEKVKLVLGDEAELPSAQRIRRHWDPLWIAGLKNPAALLDLAHLKGNRRPFDRDSYAPVIQLVEGLITEFITSRINKKESLSIVQSIAEDLVSTLMDDGNWRERPFALLMLEKLGPAGFERHPVVVLINEFLQAQGTRLHPLTHVDQHRSIGVNLVRNRFARRNYHERTMYKTTRKEASRLASGIEEGPIVDLPLQRVEADSTPVDELIVRVDGKPKRMEITLFKDVCSGAITGFHYSFEPTSWFTIHEGFRMSALPKEDYLASFEYKFVNDWPVYGAPDVLVLDRFSTHRGAALAGMAMKVGFEIDDMPAASGQLKGAVEKSLGDYMREHVVSQPGFTGANIMERDADRAVPECTEQQALEGAVAYIVDYYNQRQQPGTGEIRINRFTRLMDHAMAWKMPPAPGLFPGQAIPAKLTNKGISLNGLRYRSPALLRTFFDAGENVDVIVFVPKFGQDVIKVGELTGAGHVEAYLQGDFAGLGLTYDEALARHRAARRSKSTKKQAEKARDGHLNQALANDLRRGKPRRQRKITAPLVKPGANLAVPKIDPEASASGEFLGHDPTVGHEFQKLGERGGAYAVPGPGTRAVQKALELGEREPAVPSLPVTGGFLPDEPDPNARLPVQVALATPNSAPPPERKSGRQPEVNPTIKPLPKAFKL